jgi:hypothetical protein
MKIRIGVYFENLLSKIKFHSNLRRIMGTLHEDRYTFLITIFARVILAPRVFRAP